MTLWEAAVYGIIQGVSEFLPISSSGHLALLPHVMRIQDPGVVFDLAMHVGTALAVMVYFKDKLHMMLRDLIPVLKNWKGNEGFYLKNFMVATASSVALILLLRPISVYARTPNWVVFNLIFFGILLAMADIWHRRQHGDNEAKQGIFYLQSQWRLAALIGLAQALAIFPGVSRSGITLTTALLFGVTRKDAGDFSFLLSLPIIIAGALVSIPKVIGDSRAGVDVLSLVTGVAVSFVVGWFTIKIFLAMISKIPLWSFSIYRILLAVLMLVAVI